MRRKLALVLVLAFLSGITGCRDKPVEEGSVDTTLNEPSEEARPTETVESQEELANGLEEFDPEGRAAAAAQDAYEAAQGAAEEARQYEKANRAEPRGVVPRGNPGSWATTNDYPARALREEREGTVSFRVTVDPSGRVADCEIISSSGHADLDQATCDNVRRRARFSPAIGDDGNPTIGSYSNRVRWVIPMD